MGKLIKLKVKGKSPLKLAELEKLALAVLKIVGIRQATEISLFFVSDRKITELNRKYRKVSRSTDVLSFPLEEPKCELGPVVTCQIKSIEKPLMLGDIFISFETAKRQARMAGRSYRDEIETLFVHGMLHLVGLDHERSLEEERIWQKLSAGILNAYKRKI